MSTIKALIESVLAQNPTESIADVRIGLGYTAVKLSSGNCGVACMLRYQLRNDTCSLLGQAGTLAGTRVSQILPLAGSPSVVEASVGLAALNALAHPEMDRAPREDLVEALQIRQSDRVAMVGYIEPIVARIKQRCETFFVFDEAKFGLNGIIESSQEAAILPSCEIVVLSATSLLNHTFDSLVAMASHAREVCVLGPSTPLFPAFFRARGITLLAGRQITNPDKLLQIVSEAGGTKRFGKVTQKINLVLKPCYQD